MLSMLHVTAMSVSVLNPRTFDHGLQARASFGDENSAQYRLRTRERHDVPAICEYV